MTRSERAILRSTWMRHFYDMKAIKPKSDYYRYRNAMALPFAQKKSSKKENKKDERYLSLPGDETRFFGTQN